MAPVWPPSVTPEAAAAAAAGAEDGVEGAEDQMMDGDGEGDGEADGEGAVLSPQPVPFNHFPATRLLPDRRVIDGFSTLIVSG